MNLDIARFRAAFKQGFADPHYQEQLRRPLQAAHEQARHTLAREILSPRVSQSQFDAACADAVTVLNVPGAFPAHWGQALESALNDDEQRKQFTIRLNALLHIDQSIEKRFEGFAAVLTGLKLLDWPMVSVFPALVFPERFFMVNPASWPSEAGLKLPARPGWEAWRQSQRWAHQLKKELSELAPADLLDVYALGNYLARPTD